MDGTTKTIIDRVQYIDLTSQQNAQCHYDPFKAPWPPDVDARVFRPGIGPPMMQLRPGGTMPDGLYKQIMRNATRRHYQQPTRLRRN